MNFTRIHSIAFLLLGSLDLFAAEKPIRGNQEDHLPPGKIYFVFFSCMVLTWRFISYASVKRISSDLFFQHFNWRASIQTLEEAVAICLLRFRLQTATAHTSEKK